MVVRTFTYCYYYYGFAENVSRGEEESWSSEGPVPLIRIPNSQLKIHSNATLLTSAKLAISCGWISISVIYKLDQTQFLSLAKSLSLCELNISLTLNRILSRNARFCMPIAIYSQIPSGNNSLFRYFLPLVLNSEFSNGTSITDECARLNRAGRSFRGGIWITKMLWVGGVEGKSYSRDTRVSDP